MNLALLRSMMTVFENRLQQMEGKANTVEAMKGDKGDKGEAGIAGPAGPTGKQGRAGAKGKDGKDGKDGADGKDGVGVESASIDLDGHLVFTLTDGSTLDAGALDELFTPERASEVIHYVTKGGGSVDLSGIESRLDDIESKNSEQDQRLDTVENSNTTSEQRLDDIEAKDTEQDTRLDNAESKNTEQDNRLDAIEAEQSTQNTQITNNTNTNNQQDTRLDAIESEQTTQNSNINSNTVKNSEQDARLDALEANSTPTLKRTPIESSGVATRPLDVNFTVDPDRDAYVSYNLRVVATLSVSPSPISAALEVSQDGVNFVTLAEAAQASTVSLGGLLSINLLQDYTTQLAGMIPAGSVVRIRTVGQLPPANTITFSNGHETILDIRYV